MSSNWLNDQPLTKEKFWEVVKECLEEVTKLKNDLTPELKIWDLYRTLTP